MKVEDQEISMDRTIERDLCPDLHAESGDQWKRMQSCEICEWRMEERERFSALKRK